MTTRRPHRITLAVCLRAGLAAAVLGSSTQSYAQTPGKVSAREAERAIRYLQYQLHDFYAHAGAIDAPWPNKNCRGLTERDCFFADRECPECLWDGDEPFIKLAEGFDRAAALVARAPGGGVRADLLNWLAGQQVGTWVRAGDLERAVRSATRCNAALWWCESLRALVAHRERDHAKADELFVRALRLAPSHIRCMWNDLMPLTDSAAAVRHPAGKPGLLGPIGPCRSFDDAKEFWTLADPLFSQPGNERMTEHYARQVDLQISRDFLRMMKNNGRDGLFVQRYVAMISHGRPTSYEWRSSGGGGGASFTPSGPGRRPPLSRRQGPAWKAESAPRGTVKLEFGPPAAQSFTLSMSLAEALIATPARFEPADKHRRESYLPPYGRVTSFPLQTGFFRIANEPVLLVRSRVPSHEDNPARDWQLHGWDGTAWRQSAVVRSTDTLTAWLKTPWQPQIVSLEAVHDSGAYRARTGNRPPESAGTTALSSVIVIDGNTEPGTLADAARAMLPTTTILPDQRTGGYWELYTPSTRTAVIELAVKRADPGVLSRVFGIGRQPDRTVRWTEELQPRNGVVARAIGLDLAALPAGDYDVALTLVLDGGDVLRSVTRVVITE